MDAGSSNLPWKPLLKDEKTIHKVKGIILSTKYLVFDTFIAFREIFALRDVSCKILLYINKIKILLQILLTKGDYEIAKKVFSYAAAYASGAASTIIPPSFRLRSNCNILISDRMYFSL